MRFAWQKGPGPAIRAIRLDKSHESQGPAPFSFFDLNSGKVETVLKNVRQVVAFDGDWMAVSSTDPRIMKLWNFKTGLFIAKQTLGPVEALCFRQGSNTELPCLLAALSRGKVQVWHLIEKDQPKKEVDELENQLSKLQID